MSTSPLFRVVDGWCPLYPSATRKSGEAGASAPPGQSPLQSGAKRCNAVQRRQHSREQRFDYVVCVAPLLRLCVANAFVQADGKQSSGNADDYVDAVANDTICQYTIHTRRDFVLHPRSGLDFAKQTAFAPASPLRGWTQMTKSSAPLRLCRVPGLRPPRSGAENFVFFVKKRRRTSASPLRGWGPGTRQSQSGVLAGALDYINVEKQTSNLRMRRRS
jgi:hypothetical protein